MKFKTFLINMNRSTERLVFMSTQLRNLGIDFVREEAVDAKLYDFHKEYDEALSKKLNGRPLALVEKGCALSHRHILEKIVHERLDYALILEDDVEFPDNFKEVLDEALTQRKEGATSWEYLAFNYPTVGLKFVRLWLFLLSEQFRKTPSVSLYLKIPLYLLKFIAIATLSLFEGVRDHFYTKLYPLGKPSKFYRPMYLAGTYLVTLAGAKKLLEMQYKLIYPADRIQNIARIKNGLKLYWNVPLLVKQRRDKFESTMYQNKDYVFNKYD